MPCFATLQHAGAAERSDTPAVVELFGPGGSPGYALTYAELQRILDRAGPFPSAAHVLIRNLDGADDTPANVVLNGHNELAPHNLPGGTRVRIRVEGETLFLGRLAKREEMGRAAALRLTFLDDRQLLARLPLHGARVVRHALGREHVIERVRFEQALLQHALSIGERRIVSPRR